MDKLVVCGDKEVRLLYTSKSIVTLEAKAAEKMGPLGLRYLNARSGYGLTSKDKIPLNLLLMYLDIDTDYMLWFWGKGLDHKNSGAEPADVFGLYDAYMNAEDPDDGTRFIAWKQAAIDAANLSRGIDSKKLNEKNEELQKKAKEEAEVREMEAKAKAKEAQDAMNSERLKNSV